MKDQVFWEYFVFAIVAAMIMVAATHQAVALPFASGDERPVADAGTVNRLAKPPMAQDGTDHTTSQGAVSLHH